MAPRTRLRSANRAAPRLRSENTKRLGGPTRDSEGVEELLGVYLDHHPGAGTARIVAAYGLAHAAHDGVTRRSGDPYITHPVEVAEITADLGLDEASVCAALLHDVVEDTDVTLEQIRDLYLHDDPDGRFAGDAVFADDVAALVDGLTKLDGLHFDTEDGRRAADLRRLLTSIARDPRVLVVKLADRLHNMRTLSALSETKRVRIATETREVYAPLAHRLGMGNLRAELEDLCFATLEPDAYTAIARDTAARRAGVDDELDDMCADLAADLAAATIDAEVTWRLKHLWGIYSKMTRQHRSFDEIHDVVGMRVIVPDVADCYAALGLAHARWNPVPGTFTDYIANPRFNMYQSLHTTVWGPSGRVVELQVRTPEMHEVAEMGVAAHFSYKDNDADLDDIATGAWMRRLLDIARDNDAATYLSDVVGDLARPEIHCLTPNGRIVTLPDGATPIDFAYQVHTEIGNRAVGARVDGALVGLDHRLRGGERVEIITSADAARGPNADWTQWVVTPRARQLIRRWHSRARRDTSAATGRVRILDALERREARTGQPYTGALDDGLEQIRGRWGFHDGVSLAAAVGEGRISAEAVAARLTPRIAAPAPTPTQSVPGRTNVLVEGVADIEVYLAQCCAPQPPDPIVGWVTRGRGVSVHRLDCTNASELGSRDDARIVGVTWADMPTASTSADLALTSFDHPGILADVTAVIAAAGGDIRSMSADCAHGRAALRYRIAVSGSTALEAITAGCWDVPGVIDVELSDVVAPPATT